jgi:hypothetical protein
MDLAVPVYRRQASFNALPNARVSAPGGPEAYGAGVAGEFSQLAERSRRLAEELEDVETLEMVNAFKRDVSAYHNDPEKGVLNRVGKDAIGLHEESTVWMENAAEEYAGKAKTPRMAANFRRMAGQAITGQGEQNSRYEGKQIREYREAEADATIATALDEATKNWQDDKAFDAAIETAGMAYLVKTQGQGCRSSVIMSPHKSSEKMSSLCRRE